MKDHSALIEAANAYHDHRFYGEVVKIPSYTSSPYTVLCGDDFVHIDIVLFTGWNPVDGFYKTKAGYHAGTLYISDRIP